MDIRAYFPMLKWIDWSMRLIINEVPLPERIRLWNTWRNISHCAKNWRGGLDDCDLSALQFRRLVCAATAVNTLQTKKFFLEKQSETGKWNGFKWWTFNEYEGLRDWETTKQLLMLNDNSPGATPSFGLTFQSCLKSDFHNNSSLPTRYHERLTHLQASNS